MQHTVHDHFVTRLFISDADVCIYVRFNFLISFSILSKLD
jgi:hypothetical protein